MLMEIEHNIRRQLTIGHPQNHVWYEVVRSFKYTDAHEPYIFISYLYVRPEDRMQSIGTQLINRCKDVAREFQLPLILSVQAYADKPMTNKQLYAMYEKMGFERTFFNYMKWLPDVKPVTIYPNTTANETLQQIAA